MLSLTIEIFVESLGWFGYYAKIFCECLFSFRDPYVYFIVFVLVLVSQTLSGHINLTSIKVSTAKPRALS